MAARGRGTYVRNTWDWLHHDNCIAQCNGAFNGAFPQVLLHNNSPEGFLFDIYRVRFETDNAGFLSVNARSVTSPTQAAPNASVFRYDTLLGSPNGELLVPTALLTGTALSIVGTINNATVLDIEMASGGPFARIPAGWSLQLNNSLGAAHNFTLTVWFQMITEKFTPAS